MMSRELDYVHQHSEDWHQCRSIQAPQDAANLVEVTGQGVGLCVCV